MSARNVFVVGAGVVGMACARHLQRAGCEVTVVDRQPPGAGCSKGNAGVFAFNAILPLAHSSILRGIPAMLMDPLGPLAIRWSYLPRLLPWLLRFLANAQARSVNHNTVALAALARHARSGWEPLLRGTAGALVKCDGWLTVYETEQGFRKNTAERARQRDFGIEVREFSVEDVRAMVPALTRSVVRGVYFPDACHTIDPHRLVSELTREFVEAGGRLCESNVNAVGLSSDAGIVLSTSRGEEVAERVVVAAGAWSRHLAASAGDILPLDTERGYHVMLPTPEVQPPLPVMSGEHKFVTTPMEGGLRLAGTVELAGLERPPDYARARVLLEHGRRMWPGLNGEGYTQWMGFRPTLPDSLPVIGRSPRHSGLFYAFGHQHVGLTLAGVTGQLIAGLVTGQDTGLDLQPYRPDRF